MKNIEDIKQTNDAFLSIIDYCKNNNLVFWSDHKGYHYRMYIGSPTFFEDQVKHSDYGAFKITPEFVKEEKLNLKFIPSEQEKTCSLQLWNPWVMQDTHNHEYHLFFKCIESDKSHAIYKSLFDSFFPQKQQFKIGHILKHGNIILNGNINIEKWSKILKILTPENIENFWNQKEEVNFFTSLLKKVKNKNDVQFFLEGLLNKYEIKSDDFNDKSLNFSNLVLTIFSKSDLLSDYSEKYLFIKQALNQQDIFNPSNNLHIEKSSLSVFELLHYYPIENQNIESYSKEIISISKEIFNHPKLIKIGLMNGDSVEKSNEICFYLNIKHQSSFEAKDFEIILKNIVLFFHEKNSIADSKETVDSFVQKWYLEHTLEDKKNNQRKNKL